MSNILNFSKRLTAYNFSDTLFKSFVINNDAVFQTYVWRLAQLDTEVQ